MPSTATPNAAAGPTTKTINVTFDRATWTTSGTAFPAPLDALGTAVQLDILEVLLEISRRTAPPISLGFFLSDSWAWMRYLPALQSGTELRLRQEWDDLDPHQKTILSDDFGVGATMRLLGDALGFQWVCPTGYFLSQTQLARAWRQPGKRGPTKSPDFIATDATGSFHLVECKGTQQTLSSLTSSLQSGVAQKKNINFTRAQVGQRLVAGLFIPQFWSQETATLVVRDPRADADALEIDLPPTQISSIILSGDLASTLCAARLPSLGNLVATNERHGARDSEAVRLERAALQSVTHHNTVYLTTGQRHPYSSPDGHTGMLHVEVGISEATFAAVQDPNVVDLVAHFAHRPALTLKREPGSIEGLTNLGFYFSARVA